MIKHEDNIHCPVCQRGFTPDDEPLCPHCAVYVPEAFQVIVKRLKESRVSMPPLVTCTNCRLPYYQTSAAHVCAEWEKGAKEKTMKTTTDTMNRHYNDEPIRKVEGVLLTRGQCGWQVEKLPIHGCRIVDNTGRIVAADVYDEVLAEQIVDEHNQILAQKWEEQHGLRQSITE